MKKKILVGSMIAIAMLIGASFTSVVGYKSVESDVKESPLFNARINSALKKDNKDFSCDYIGKSKVSVIFFPQRDKALFSFQKVVDGISNMDDLTFNIFVDKVVIKLCESKVLEEKDFLKIRELFNFIRNNPEDAKKYPFDLKKHSYTIGCPPPTFEETPEFCFKLFVLLGIIIVTFPIWFPIYILLRLLGIITSPDIVHT